MMSMALVDVDRSTDGPVIVRVGVAVVVAITDDADRTIVVLMSLIDDHGVAVMPVAVNEYC